MEIKICSSCKISKNLEYFYKLKNSKDGFNNSCKECMNAKSKKWLENNKEKQKERRRQYHIKNNAQQNAINLEYYQKNKNKEIFKNKRKEYRVKYKKENREKILNDYKIYSKKYKENKKKTDPLFKLTCNIRCLIRNSICLKNSYTKKNKTTEILGCSFEEFKKYLESKFEPWMNWENRGKYNGTINFGWDLDHIIPMKTSKTEEDVLKLNHYTNFQPLCSFINRHIKKDKII